MSTAVPVSLVLLLGAGCASSASVPPAPVAWPPGAYYLETSISYASGFGERRETYSGELTIEPDGSMRLESHQRGVCQDPTPPQQRRDEELRRRTFRCGDVLYVLRPGQETVIGGIRATVQEDYETTECIARSSTGGCDRTTRVTRTRTVTKEAPLRVRTLD